ncbi:MAG TPA: hypothetical protein VIJ86_09325 [Acidimicrobiales bacterium]
MTMVEGRGQKILKNRSLMWLIFSVFLVTCLSIMSVSSVAGDTLAVAGVIAMAVVVVKIRLTNQVTGEVRDRTHCQFCGSILQGFAGTRRSTCGQCGKEQPWAR